MSVYVKIPSQIAKDAGIVQNHISNSLRQLKEHELVECINPEVRKGRLYRLTDKGDEIVRGLKEEQIYWYALDLSSIRPMYTQLSTTLKQIL